MNVFDRLFPRHTRRQGNVRRSGREAATSGGRNRLRGLGLPEQFERRDLLAVSGVVPNTPASFFIDTGTGLNSEYAAFAIQNDASAMSDVWVQATSFSSTSPANLKIGLAPNEDGFYHLGALAPSATGMAYFFLTGTGASAAVQNFQIKVFDGDPNNGGTQVFMQPCSFDSVQDTIEASPNQITSVTFSPANPSVGDTLTMQVDGYLGNNANGVLFSPATKTNWLPDVFELRGTNVQVSGVPLNTPPNRLYFNSLPTPIVNQQPFTITYTFLITGPSQTPTQTSPTQYCQYNNQGTYKHHRISSIPFPSIPALKYELQVKKDDGQTTYVPGTTTTYVIEITNTGKIDVNNVSVADMLPMQLDPASTWTVNYGSEVPGTLPVNGSGNISGTVNLKKLTGKVIITIVGKILSSTVGEMINEVTIQAPGDTPLSAQDKNTCTPKGDLQVVKTGTVSAAPGQPISYTIVVSNLVVAGGSSDALGASIADAFPLGPTGLSAVNWNVSGVTGGATVTGATTGTSSLATTANIPVGGTVTFTVSGTIATSTLLPSLANTATVTAPVGYTDTNLSNNTSTWTTTLSRQGDLKVVKTGTVSAAPGQPISYTIVVSNLVVAGGSSDVIGASIADAFPLGPTGLSAVNWNVTGVTGGATVTGATTGTSALATTANIPVGGTVTFTVTGTIASSAPPPSLANTATVTAPAGYTDTNLLNNTSTWTTTLARQGDLQVVKTGTVSAAPGQPISYTIVVSNLVVAGGSSDVIGASIADAFPLGPTGLSAVNWNVTGVTGGAVVTGATTGTSALTTTADIPVGGTVTFTVTGTIASSAAPPSLANTATVTAPVGYTDTNLSNNTSIWTTGLGRQGDLAVVKTGTVSAAPGQPISYTIVVSNLVVAGGSSDVLGAAIADAFPLGPTGLSGVNWNVTGVTGGATVTGATTGTASLSTTADIPVGGTVTFTVTGTIASSATPPSLANTATITAPAGYTDTNPANDTSTWTTTLARQGDLQVVKTGTASAAPGQPISYTIVVSNLVVPGGSSDVLGVSIADAFPLGPTGLSAVNWNVTGVTGGAVVTGATTGTSALTTTADIPVGGTVTFTVTGTIASSAVPPSLANTATVTAPVGYTDTNVSNNTSTWTTTLARQGDLQVVKTGTVSAAPGQPISYTIVVSNLVVAGGSSDVIGASIADAFPLGAAGLSAVNWNVTGATGGATVTGATTGTSALTTTADIPVGGTVTVTVTGTIASSAVPPSLANTATVTAPVGYKDTNLSNNTSKWTTTLARQGDLQVVKTGTVSAAPGQPISYTIVVSNLVVAGGSSDVLGASIADAFPLGPTGLSAVNWNVTGVTGGATVTGATTGTSALTTTADIPVGGTVTFTVTGTIASSAVPPSLANTATVTAPAGYTDTNLSNNASTWTTGLGRQGDLSVVKTGTVSAAPGQPISYTIVVSNLVVAGGSSDVLGASIADSFPLGPSGLSAVNWNVTGVTGGAVVTGATTGTSALTTTADIPVGGTVTFTVTGTIASSAVPPSLANTATVTAPAGYTDTNLSNNASTWTTGLGRQGDLSVVKTGTVSAAPGQPISYTIVVSNLVVAGGSSDVIGASIADAFPLGPTGLSGVSWSVTGVTGGATVTGATTGTSALTTTADIPVGGTVTFTVTGTIASSAPPPSLANTATVTAPVGYTDTNPANDTSTWTTTLSRQGDLSVVKTGTASAAPGQPISYTIVVSNLVVPGGSSDVLGAVIADAFPLGATGLSGVNWNVTGVTGGATVTGATTGTSALTTTADIPVGGTVTFTVTGTIASSALPPSLVNTATVAAPAGYTDTNLLNNTSTWTTTLARQGDLSVVKTGTASAAPGQAISYTIVVSNLVVPGGSSDVLGASIADAFPLGPTGLLGVNWNVTGVTGGATVTGATTGTASLSTTADIPVGGTVTFTVTGTIASSALPPSLANTATVTAPVGYTDTNPTNDTSTWTTQLARQGDLQVVKTGTASAAPGQPISYTIVVSNLVVPGGSSDVLGAVIADAFPLGAAGLSAVNWDVTGLTGGATVTGATTGTSALTTTADIPVGGTVTFTVTGTIASSALPPSLANTATVTAPVGYTDTNPANNTSTWTTTLARQGDLSVVKTGTASAAPGQPISYTIVVSNLVVPGGSSDVLGAVIADAFPLGPTGLSAVNWNVTGVTGGATVTGATTGTSALTTTADIPVGGTVTFTVTGTIASSAPPPSLANTATVTAPVGYTDTNLLNNTSTWTTTLARQGDLQVVKTGTVSAAPGQPISYTIVVSNLVVPGGSSDVLGAVIADAFPLGPTGLSGVNWNVTGVTGGATVTGATTGTSALSTTADIPVGGTVTFTVTGTIASSALPPSLSNTATITAPAGYTDTNPTNDTSTWTTQLARQGDLQVVKTGTASVAPGQPISYTIVVSNLVVPGGSSDVLGAVIADAFPLGPTGLSAVNWNVTGVTGGATVTGATTGTAALSTTADIPVGGTVTFTVTGTIASSALPPSLANTATVTAPVGYTDTNPANDTSTWTTQLARQGDLSVVKTGTASAAPGQPISYTIVVSNLVVPGGSSDVLGAVIADAFPLGAAGLSAVNWDVTGLTGGATVTGATTGTSALTTTADIPVGGTVTFTVTGTIASSALPPSLANTATVTAPVGYTDTNPANDTSTWTTALSPQGDLAIVKTGTGGAAPGQPISYTIVVSNLTISGGSSDAFGAAITDPFPLGVTGLSNVSWSVTATTGGATVTGDSTGTAALSTTANIPVGGTITFTVNATIAITAVFPLVNTATVAAPADYFDIDLANNTSTWTVEPIGPTAGEGVAVLGTDDGCPVPPVVRVIDKFGTIVAVIDSTNGLYEASFRGSVRVASGDITGDGIADIVVAPGRGRVGQIRAFIASGSGVSTVYTYDSRYDTLPFGAAWRSGVEVAVGDVDGDGIGDIIAGQSRGAGLVRTFPVGDPLLPDPVANTATRSFRGFPPTYAGGVMLAAADLTGDGAAEVIVGSNAGIRARVRVFDVTGTPTVIRTILPFASTYRGGVTLSVGRYDSDSTPDIFVGAGIGGQSTVAIYSGATGTKLKTVTAFASFAKRNARVFTAGIDVNGTGTVSSLYAVKGLSGGGGAKGVRQNDLLSNTAAPLTSDPALSPPLRIAPIPRALVQVGLRRSGG